MPPHSCCPTGSLTTSLDGSHVHHEHAAGDGRMHVVVDFESLVVDLPPTTACRDLRNNCHDVESKLLGNEDEDDTHWKEWVWTHYKEDILARMTFRRPSWTSGSRGSSNFNSNDDLTGLRVQRQDDGHADQDADDEAEGTSDTTANTSACGARSTDSLSNMQLDLLERVARAQRKYLQSQGPMAVYNCLLEGLLEMMGSEFGFIGEVRYNASGTMYLHIHVTTDITWDDETRRFYEKHHKAGLDFYELNNLFGRVLLDHMPIISNDPKTDPRATGLPPGHPMVRKFLGVPIFNDSGELLGMFAVANKRTDYGQQDISFLEPFTDTCANVIQAYFHIQENERLIQSLATANAQLKQAHQQVVQTSKLQLRHFACMSHEIRTPLNCILGMLSLLDNKQQPSESFYDENQSTTSSIPPATALTPALQEEYMKMVIASGELLATVVNDVLDYSKLESGDVAFDIRPNCQLQDTLDSVVRSMQVKAASQNVPIKLDTILDPRIPQTIATDPSRLQQVLFNLLGNAIKFSRPGGTVELHVQVVDHDDQEEAPGYTYDPNSCDHCDFDMNDDDLVNPTAPCTQSSCRQHRPPQHQRLQQTSAYGRYVRFIVKDYGKGIERNEFEKVFKPFMQATAETEEVQGGTGLGLAITAKLVTGLGGVISVDSCFGEWSRFTVDFPLREEPQDVAELSGQLQGVTLLLVHPSQETQTASTPATPTSRTTTATCVESLNFRERLVGVFHAYNIPIECLSTMEEIHAKYLSPDRKYVFLVHESLYREDAYHSLAKTANTMVLTYGPNFTVQDSTVHIGDPLQVLPSVLMKSIVQHLSTSMNNNRGSPADKTPMPTLRRMSSTVESTKCSDRGSLLFQNAKVLVAEDNLVNQKVIARVLQRLGIGFFEIANNGLEAVEMDAAIDYDVVLMDLEMPVMDGIEATKAIVAREDGREVPPVIFVTAHAMRSHEVECYRAGASAFLSKPYNIDKIEAVLTECLLSSAKGGDCSGRLFPTVR